MTATGEILALTDIKSNPNNDMDESGAYQDVIGGILTSIGAIKIGVSIPLFISSKKRKNERNQRIIELNHNFAE
ncbi:hypothetical protein ACRASX_15640 [Flavobacterium sp. TMP13]|uniref:hypothetical protein n=1 Tax=Flavobacterium sp. TMP13 TaxID=3425950 RepID=UPI003D77DEEA